MFKLLQWLIIAMPALVLAGRAPADIGATLIGVLGAAYALHSRLKICFNLEAKLWLSLYALALISTVLHAPEEWLSSALWLRFLLFYAAVRMILQHSNTKHITYGLLGAIGVAVVDTYVQYFTGTSLTGHPIPNFGDFAGMRLSGPLSNFNIGNVLLKFSLLALAFGICGRLRTGLLVAVCVPALVLVPLSGERSITLVLLVITAACALVLLLKDARLRLLALAFVALAALGAWGLYATQSVVAARADLFIAQLADYWNTVYGQLTLGAWYQFLASPFTGTGVSAFYDTCLPLQAAGRLHYCDMHPHNLYLQWLSGAGIAAFIAFTAWVLLQAFQAAQRCLEATGSQVFPPLFTASALLGCLFPFMLHQSIFSNWPAALFFYTAAMATHMLQQKAKV